MKYSGNGFAKRSMTSKRQRESWQSKKVARSIRSVFIVSKPPKKYLKCLLTYLGIQAPRTHDLQALALLIPVERSFPVRVEDLAELNPYAVNVRYADDWREPQLNDARRALALASKVRAAVREAMPPPVVD
jgi:HEPN domain-containing protein